MENEKKNWQRMLFKTNKVWLNILEDGSPVIKNGKVRIKYQLGQNYEYWVHPDKIKPLPKTPPSKPFAPQASACKADNSTKTPAEVPEGPAPVMDKDEFNSVIHVYTDGASSGNPGPSGIGIHFTYGPHQKDISRYIGQATNNIAELEAIRVALSELKRTHIPVRLYTDSSYAHGLLVLGWRASKNKALVSAIRKLMRPFKDLKILKVKGHADNAGNNRADALATAAIKKRSFSDDEALS
jgi:ribonuclease HI